MKNHEKQVIDKNMTGQCPTISIPMGFPEIITVPQWTKPIVWTLVSSMGSKYGQADKYVKIYISMKR